MFAAADWLPDVLRRAGRFSGLLATVWLGAAAGLCTGYTHALFCTKALWRQARRGDGRRLCCFRFVVLRSSSQLVQSVTTFAGRLGAYETICGLLVWVQNTFGIDTATAEQLCADGGHGTAKLVRRFVPRCGACGGGFRLGAAGAAGNAVVPLVRQHLLPAKEEALLPAQPGRVCCNIAAACRRGSMLEICRLANKILQLHRRAAGGRPAVGRETFALMSIFRAGIPRRCVPLAGRRDKHCPVLGAVHRLRCRGSSSCCWNCPGRHGRNLPSYIFVVQQVDGNFIAAAHSGQEPHGLPGAGRAGWPSRGERA